MKNHYQTLGVSTTASVEEIKDAYKRLSKQVHPDLNFGDKIFEELFKNVNEAYQVLSDQDKRQEYDNNYRHFFFASNFSAAMQDENVASVLQPRFSFRRKFIINGVICLLLVLAAVATNAIVFNDDEEIATVSAKSNLPIIVERKSPRVTANITTPVVHEPKAEKTLMVKVDEPKIDEEIQKEIKITTTSVEVVKPQEKKKLIKPTIAVKQLRWSEDDILSVIDEIRRKQLSSASNINCVRIIQSANSNVLNAFDLATYLQMNNYIIAGRLSSTNTSQGINIEVNKGCIIVTIGVVN